MLFWYQYQKMCQPKHLKYNFDLLSCCVSADSVDEEDACCHARGFLDEPPEWIEGNSLHLLSV